jgi:hypothetical protein
LGDRTCGRCRRVRGVGHRADPGPGVGGLILRHMMLKAHTTVTVDVICTNRMKYAGANRSFRLGHLQLAVLHTGGLMLEK